MENWELFKKYLFFPTGPLATLLLGQPIYHFSRRIVKDENIPVSSLRNIIVIRLDEIGDLVLTSPFLRELRYNFPDSHITLIVKPETYNLVEKCPYIDELFLIDLSGSRYVRPFLRHLRALGLASRHLWRKKYDLAIIPRYDTDYYHATILSYMSGARYRLGFTEKTTSTKKLLNRGYDRLLTHICQNTTLCHEVEHSLKLIRFLGFSIQSDHLELWPSEEDRIFAHTLMQKIYRDFGHSPLAALSPGAGHPRRQWPASNFARIARWWVDSFHGVALIIGGPGYEKTGAAIARNVGKNIINLAGKTTLRQTGEILRYCHIFVGNDSGPMHLAAAANLPVVEISIFFQQRTFRSCVFPHTFSSLENSSSNHITKSADLSL